MDTNGLDTHLFFCESSHPHALLTRHLCAFIVTRAPFLHWVNERCIVQVSIVAGMMAGVAGAIVSQPADTVLTRLNSSTVRKPVNPSPPALPPQSSPQAQWVRSSVDVVGRPAVAGAVGVPSVGSLSSGRLRDAPQRGNEMFGLGLGERARVQDVVEGGEGIDSGISEQALSGGGRGDRREEPEGREVADWRRVVKEMMTGDLGPMGLFR